MDEFRDENTLLDEDESDSHIKLRGKLKFGPLSLGTHLGSSSASGSNVITGARSSDNVASVGSPNGDYRISVNSNMDFPVAGRSRSSITSSSSVPAASYDVEQSPSTDRSVDGVMENRPNGRSSSLQNHSRLFPLSRLIKSQPNTENSPKKATSVADLDDIQPLSSESNTGIILDSKLLPKDGTTSNSKESSPRTAEEGYKRLMSEISYCGSEDFTDTDPIQFEKPSGFCWVCHHKTIQKNWKVFLASIFLTIAGLALIGSGIAIGVVYGFTTDLKSVVFIVGGILCLVPGSYHLVFLILAAYGVNGFKFSKLPTIKIPE